MTAPPNITGCSFQDNVSTDCLLSAVNYLEDGYGRYPGKEIKINYLLIEGENFGRNPQVKLESTDGIRFLPHRLEYSFGTGIIHYWFWCVSTVTETKEIQNASEQGDERTPGRLTGTLTVIIETDESTESGSATVSITPVAPDNPNNPDNPNDPDNPDGPDGD